MGSPWAGQSAVRPARAASLHWRCVAPVASCNASSVRSIGRATVDDRQMMREQRWQIALPSLKPLVAVLGALLRARAACEALLGAGAGGRTRPARWTNCCAGGRRLDRWLLARRLLRRRCRPWPATRCRRAVARAAALAAAAALGAGQLRPDAPPASTRHRPRRTGWTAPPGGRCWRWRATTASCRCRTFRERYRAAARRVARPTSCAACGTSAPSTLLPLPRQGPAAARRPAARAAAARRAALSLRRAAAARGLRALQLADRAGARGLACAPGAARAARRARRRAPRCGTRCRRGTRPASSRLLQRFSVELASRRRHRRAAAPLPAAATSTRALRFELLLAQAALWRVRGDAEQRTRRLRTTRCAWPPPPTTSCCWASSTARSGKFHEARDIDRAFACYQDSADFLRQAGVHDEPQRADADVLGEYVDDAGAAGLALRAAQRPARRRPCSTAPRRCAQHSAGAPTSSADAGADLGRILAPRRRPAARAGAQAPRAAAVRTHSATGHRC